MSNLESLVMTTSRSIQINQAYQNEINKMETFLATVEARPNLTEAEQTCIAESKVKIQELKEFVANHKAQIQKHLKDNNLGIIYDVAETFNEFLR